MGADTVIALHRITRLPLVETEPVFAHYPRMKLGVLDSAHRYAARLAPLAESLIAAGGAADRWVLTAPPLINIPAGANLICRQLYRQLKRTIADPERLELIDIVTRFDRGPAREFARRGVYARMGIDQRIASREAESAALIPEPRFGDARVLFVNDINVTGTQQRFMRRYFDPLTPVAVHWLYLIDVDPAIGCVQPALEDAINGLSHTSLESFTELLSGARMQYTGKCLARLFAYPTDQFERLIGRLDPPRRRRLFELARREDRFDGGAFAAKFTLLTRSARTRSGRAKEARNGAR